MKKIILASALALTATVAVASGINLRKVNKVIKSVIESEVTPLINKIEIKFDERSNLQSLAKLNTGVSASATAVSSKWSERPTSLDIKASLKTLSTDEKNTNLETVISLGTKTDAVNFYSYVTALVAKDMQAGEEPLDDLEKEFLVWLNTATQTQRLDQIPSQLEKLVVLIKKALEADTPENPEDADWSAYAKLVNSLKVDTKIQGFKTIEVILKTTEVVTMNDIVVSNLALKISETGFSLNGQVDFSAPTESVASFLQQATEFLMTIQNADAETLEGLRDMARGYIDMAESFVNGDTDR